MIMHNSVSRLSIFAIIVLYLSSCGPKEKNYSGGIASNDNFSNPISLYVDYISNYSGGVISRSSPIQLRLAKAAGDSLAGTEIKSFFKFSPNIDGTSTWLDNRTIVFSPSSLLPSGKSFKATADLSKVLPDLSSDRKEFKFSFQTFIQNFEASIIGPQSYEKNDLKNIKIVGRLQTADFVPFEDVKGILVAEQDGKDLDVSWESLKNKNTFRFIVENVERKNKQDKVKLDFKGQSIGVNKEEQIKVDIPALDDFKVISTNIVRGEENYISVLFSDPLDEKQNLSGIVFLQSVTNKPRLVVNLNELKIYPTKEITTNALLKIFQSIKNTAGYELKKEYQTNLQFTQIKPKVRLVDNSNKALLPDSKSLILPFEAVGLSAVDVTVIRIFEDNVLQYLQVNSLGQQRQITRVGRPVAKTTIPLNTSGVTNLNQWNRFILNLEDLFKAETGAIYQISINFRKKHSLYFCPSDDSNIESIEDNLDEWGAQDEFSYWDNYENSYNSNYDWSQRDNPCSNSYYTSRNKVQKILFASNFGIIAKKRDKGDISIFVTDLLTTKPIPDVLIQLFDYQQQKLTEGKTNNEGKLILSGKGSPFVVIAKKNQEHGYLKIDDGSSLSLSNFNTSGNKIQYGLKGFIYGERGVWRPSDTIHLGFILEDIEDNVPERHPVVMELWNPLGQLFSRKISTQPIGNIYRFDMLTESNSPTGYWLAKAKVGGAVFNKTIRIETVKPNRLKIELDFGKDKLIYRDLNLSGDLNVRWLTGAKANELKTEFEYQLSPIKTQFANYPGFSFDDESKEFFGERQIAFQGRLNADGYTKLSIKLGKQTRAPGALKAKFFGKVFEEGGDFSIKNVSIPFYPYEVFVGIKIPEGDKRGILLTDEDHKIRVVTLDSDGNPVNRKKLKVQIYKLNWKWWWDNSSDNISNYIGSSYREPIKEDYVNTKDGECILKLRIDYPDWGRYFVKISDPSSGHSAGHIVYLDWPGWAGKGKRGDLDGAAMLDFGIEKEDYQVGEKINLSIPSTAGNRILVSLENGSKIVQTFWTETKAEWTNIEFEATSEMAPNIYIHLTMIQPHAQTGNDLPMRLYGINSVKILDPQTELNPVLSMPDELRPEQKYKITITEANKKAMAYTIAVVDEGLLDLTNFVTPDPWSGFFIKEALGIKTWDVYDDVIGAYGGQIERLLSIGGDDELKVKDEKERNRFKPVVQFIGPFYLEAGKKKEHNLTMPQYIGSVKAMVIAAAEGSYGKADKVVPVKQPVMILATLPRVAGPSESIKLPVNVFALNDKVKDVTVSVKTTGTLKIDGSDTQYVSFTGQGDKVIYFDLLADNTLGPAKVEVIAKSGDMSATYDVDMNVIPRNPDIFIVEDKIVKQDDVWKIDYKPIGLAGHNTGTIEFSILPPLNLDQRLKYLIRYPHGCVEQTTSSVFAQLYIGELTAIDKKTKSNIQSNIEAGISRLKSFQLSSGAYSYWPGNSSPDPWGTNYAGHFLLEAKKRGYAVSESMISKWIGSQTEEAERWTPTSGRHSNMLTQAYRLYTLAIAKNPALGAMNRMKELSELSGQSRFRLALAYAIAGYEEEAMDLILNEVANYENVRDGDIYTYGSPIRDKAMILETLTHLGKKEDAFALVREIAQEMGNKNKWMSTQTTAYSFIGIAEYVKSFPISNSINVSVDDVADLANISGEQYVLQYYLDDPDMNRLLTVTNTGDGPIFARIIRAGIPIEGTEQTENKNLNISARYLSLNNDIVDKSALSQGTNFKLEVIVENPGLAGDYNELALTQIFPSGWEIINTRLEEQGETQNSDPEQEYTDIRDDRVLKYFDLKAGEKKTFTVLLNAAYRGRYFMPALSVEAMYDNSRYARISGEWIEVLMER
jgi:alpha-2-macroglobulin